MRLPFHRTSRTLRPIRGAAWLGLAVVAAAVACSLARPTGENPDVVDRLTARAATSDRAMVASPSAAANRIGLEILARGGNAIDAAVAIAVALGAADPGDSGLGGTTYILLRLADGRSVAIDGSSRVPIHISRADLRRLFEAERKFGPELAETPGSLAGLELARSRYGTMSLAELVEPSIAIAESGFRLSSFQRASVARYLEDIRTIEPLASLVLDSAGEVLPAGTEIRLPGLARTLRRIADGGADEFYRGSIASEIEADMIRRNGFVRRADLGLMKARELTPYRGSYRGLEVLAFPAPGAGGAVIESLNMLECHTPETLRRDDVDRLQLMAEIFHIADEDDRAHAPDPNLPQPIHQPVHLAKSFAAERAAVIAPGRPVPPEAFQTRAFRPSLESQTVHVSVIDEQGNAVSLTQTLGRFFGNKIVAHDLGFLYNVLLGGLDPSDPAQLRPMTVHALDGAPTIVVADGEPLLVLGSAGSSRIPGAIATVVSNVIDRGMSLAEAVAAPRALWSLGDSTNGLMLEITPPVRADHARSLEAMGYRERFFVELPALYQEVSKFGGVNAVLRDPATGRLTGVGDPRRLGDARGL